MVQREVAVEQRGQGRGGLDLAVALVDLSGALQDHVSVRGVLGLQVHHSKVVEHQEYLLDRPALDRVYLSPVLSRRCRAVLAPHDGVHEPLPRLLPLLLTEHPRGLLRGVQGPELLRAGTCVASEEELDELDLLQQAVEYLAEVLEVELIERHCPMRLGRCCPNGISRWALSLTSRQLALGDSLSDKNVPSFTTTP